MSEPEGDPVLQNALQHAHRSTQIGSIFMHLQECQRRRAAALAVLLNLPESCAKKEPRTLKVAAGIPQGNGRFPGERSARNDSDLNNRLRKQSR
jgi:hypothetical protein